jgi:exopolysaccharide production protein ExoQ
MKFASDPALPLAGAALLVAPLAVLAPLGIAPLAGVAALLVVLQRGLLLRRWPAVDRVGLVLLALFVAWTLASAAWSLLPERSLASAVRIGVIGLGGLILLGAADALDSRQRRSVAVAFSLGAELAALLFAINLATDVGINALYSDVPTRDPVTALNRTVAVFVVLCWPLAALVGRRWRIAGAVALLVVAAVAIRQFDPGVLMVAFAGAALVFAVAAIRSRIVAGALVAMLAIGVALVPALPRLGPEIDARLMEAGNMDTSISHRLAVWSFSAARAMERPFGGWGFDTARAIPGGDEDVLILGKPFDDAPALPLHPHNAIIQVWLEAGLPALIVVVLLVGRALWRAPAHATRRLDAAGILAAAGAALIVANLSYGIWQGWWLCFLWLNAALLLAVLGRPAPPGPTEGTPI